jgi:hypothetical protein
LKDGSRHLDSPISLRLGHVLVIHHPWINSLTHLNFTFDLGDLVLKCNGEQVSHCELPPGYAAKMAWIDFAVKKKMLDTEILWAIFRAMKLDEYLFRAKERQNVFAHRAGLTDTQVSNLVNGKFREVSLVVARKVIAATKGAVTIDDLMLESEAEKEPE